MKTIKRFKTFSDLSLTKVFINELNHKNERGTLNKILTVPLNNEMALIHCLKQNVVFIKDALTEQEYMDIIIKLINTIVRLEQ